METALADSTTYYFGCHYGKEFVGAAGTTRIYIPAAGVITAAYFTTRSTTAGTGEDISLYVRLNDTTDTLVAGVGTSAQTRVFSNASMSVTVAAGDYIEMKMVCPAWATNPTTTAIGGLVYVSNTGA
jgi:hypothetical protein